MALVLFNEKDKVNKIKGNKRNLFNYLNVADLWDKNIYEDTNNFNSDLVELKKCNIQVNKIIWLYDFLVEEEEEDPEKDIKEYIENTYKNQVDKSEHNSNSQSRNLKIVNSFTNISNNSQNPNPNPNPYARPTPFKKSDDVKIENSHIEQPLIDDDEPKVIKKDKIIPSKDVKDNDKKKNYDPTLIEIQKKKEITL